MDIEKLSNALYEDLNGMITAVDNANGLVVRYECDDWAGEDKRRRFNIFCRGVVEYEVRPSPSDFVHFLVSHPLLWNHNEPHGCLYYSSQPDSRHEVLGRIWEVHERIFKGWRPLAEFANVSYGGQPVEFCRGSHGQLAHGPLPLMEAYMEAVDGLLVTNYVASHKPKGRLKVLVFDECFAVCDTVSVEEINN